MVEELARLLSTWRPAFRRRSTWIRVVSLLIGLVVASGRRTVTASLRARALDNSPWAADYLAFSRAPWEPAALFQSVLLTVIDTIEELCPGGPLVIALDDTAIRKTGKTIPGAHYQRDPMSPPFHVNLKYGLRYLHFAAILPLHRVGMDPRAISVAFPLTPAVKKPGKKATEEAQAEYRKAKRDNNLSVRAAETMQSLREMLDRTGHRERAVLFVGDSSYTNSNVLRNLPNRVHYIGRTRSDLHLVRPAPAGTRKVYGEQLPTPNELRQDETQPWQHTELYYAGGLRDVRYKESNNILWPKGTLRRPMRLLVVAPTPYTVRNGSRRKHYRDPAYLLTTDLTTPATELLQAYFDRWQIEVVHRELKTGLGVGQAQVRSTGSVVRLNSALVAVWSMVVLAAMRSKGPTRTDQYPRRALWYQPTGRERPSQDDILELLRSELPGAMASTPTYGRPRWPDLGAALAA